MHSLLRYSLITVAALLLFVPFLGHVHLFDWDEINFAECAREMLVSKDYLRAQIDFQPFWEKPPLFIWLQVLSMKAFGVNEFAARLPNAVFGVLTLCTLYHAGKKVMNEKLATWWVILYAATWLPHFYFKSGIIDPVFNYFIFLAFYLLHCARYGQRRMLHSLLSGICLGLAVMTKGPVAILVSGLAFAVYIILHRGMNGYKWRDLLLVTVGALLVMAAWFLALLIAYGWPYFQWFFTEFIVYQVRLFQTEDADHGGPFFYHWVILLIGCFPAAPFLFQYSRKRSSDTIPAKDFTRWMWILFWVVLILFSIVKTKIVHYSSLCYFPLTWLAAVQVYRLSEKQVVIKRVTKIIFASIGILFAILITALPIAGMLRERIIPMVNDPFAVGNIHAQVSWTAAEVIYGLLYLAGIITGVVLMRRDFRKAMLVVCAVQVFIIQITVIHFTPKIEAHSQRAAIDFFKQQKGKDVYVQVLAYKSYAHLFYTDKTKPSNPLYYTRDTSVKEGTPVYIPDEYWLLHGKLDKPAFFVSKIQDAPQYDTMQTLTRMYEQNGFVFYSRQ